MCIKLFHPAYLLRTLLNNVATSRHVIPAVGRGGGLNSIPESFAFSTISSNYIISLSESADRAYRLKMADNFITCHDAKCSAFQITRLSYVHCVSAEGFSVNLKGFSCAALCCKEIHWSYLERRVPKACLPCAEVC